MRSPTRTRTTPTARHFEKNPGCSSHFNKIMWAFPSSFGPTPLTAATITATVPQGIQQRPPASSHMPLQSLAAIMPAAVLRAFLRQQQLARRRGCQFFELSLPPGRQPPTACLDRHGLRLRPPLSPPSRAPATSHAHRQLHLLRADMDWSRQQLVT